MGYFASFTIFLALNSAEFCNKYLRSAASATEKGVLQLGPYLGFWAAIYIGLTVYVALFKSEGKPHSETSDDPDDTEEEHDVGVVKTYSTILEIIRLPRASHVVHILELCELLSECD